jgi:NAD(P)-dependent dehydrogenase (short-subunit alcohol dehydrogenase family)
MKSFTGKLAVLTGGGSGMGRELVLQLAAEGCSVAMCDLSAAALAETEARAVAVARAGVRITSHVCDITDEAAVQRFRDEVVAQHGTDRINVLFNNAGVFGAGSFLTDDRTTWERVFAVCWYGVYNVCRVFVPLVVACDEGYVVNTSSINALRAVHAVGTPSTAYSAGKWAVRGFTEALIEDFRTHAPHVGVSLVMPGGVGTDIRGNSQRILAATATGKVMSGVEHLRAYLAGMGVPVEDLPDATIAHLIDVQQSDIFAMPPALAARDILNGVRERRWRIFVGVGAVELDRAVRANPESIYDADGPSLIDRDLLTSMMVLSSRFEPGPGRAADGLYELRLDSSPIFCRVADGRLSLSRVPTDGVDAVVETDLATFRGLVMKQDHLDQALSDGRVRLTGDRGRLQQLLRAVAV